MAENAVSPTSGKKRGRKAEHYRTKKDDKPIEGLARRPSDGRWRIIGTSITFTEPNEQAAILRFRKYQASQNHEPFIIDNYTVTRQQLADSPMKMVTLLSKVSPNARMTIAADGTITVPEEFKEVVFWAKVREEILARPKYVAEMTGIEQIGYLEKLKKPTPSPTLAEIGTLYHDKASITRGARRASRRTS
jgi:hypothetical protein